MEEEEVQQENKINSDQKEQNCQRIQHGKESRVNPKFYQAEIPNLCFNPDKPDIQQYKKLVQKHQKKYHIEDLQLWNGNQIQNNIDEQELKEYFQFVKQLGYNDNGGLLIGGGNEKFIENKAMEVLKKNNYSFVKSKFQLLFPTLSYFNEFQPSTKVILSEQEMEEKIQQYMQQLQETKLSQEEKWKQEVVNLLKEKIPMQKIQQKLEEGKILKYDVPELVKDALDKTFAYNKIIKKTNNTKADMETLEDMSQKIEQEFKIVSNEMSQFIEGIKRSKTWVGKYFLLKNIFNETKTQNFENLFSKKKRQIIPQENKILYKTLQSSLQEYKNLPLYDEDYDQVFKTMFEEAQQVLDKLPSLIVKSSKTRGNQLDSKIKPKKAKEIIEKIQQVYVKCDEFDTFQTSYQMALQETEEVQMFLEDEREEKSSKILQEKLNLLKGHAFYSHIQEYLQKQCIYLGIVEKIKKCLKEASTLEDIKEHVQEAKKKGLYTDLIKEYELIMSKSIQWYQEVENLDEERKVLSIFDIYNNIQLDTDLIREKKIKELEQSMDGLTIDQSDLEKFQNKVKEAKQLQESYSTVIEKSSFENLAKFINDSIQTNIQVNELSKAVKSLRQGITWLLNTINLLDKYEISDKEGFIFTKEEYDRLQEIQKKIYSNQTENQIDNLLQFHIDITKDNVQIENLQLSKSQSCLPVHIIMKTKEYEQLVKLFQKTQDWNQKIDSLLSQQDLDIDLIQKEVPVLQNEAENLPIQKEKLQQVKNIQSVFSWSNKCQQVLQEFKIQQNLIDILEKNSIQVLENKIQEFNLSLENIQEQDVKQTCQKFWKENEMIITDLLKQINSQDFQIQKNNLYNNLQKLRNEGQNLKIPQQFENVKKNIIDKLQDIAQWNRKSTILKEFKKKMRVKKTEVIEKKIKKLKIKQQREINKIEKLQQKKLQKQQQQQSKIEEEESNNVDKIKKEQNQENEEQKTVTKKEENNQMEIEENKIQKSQDNLNVDKEKQKNANSNKGNFEEDLNENLYSNDDNNKKNTTKIETEDDNNNNNNDDEEQSQQQNDGEEDENDEDDEDEDDDEEDDEDDEEEEDEENEESDEFQDEDLSQMLQNQISNQEKLEKEFKIQNNMNLAKYYLKIPLMIQHFYYGLQKEVFSEEKLALKKELNDNIQYILQSNDLMQQRPVKMNQLRPFINKCHQTVYFPKLAILKKLFKWADNWQYLAATIVNTQPKIKVKIQKIISAFPQNFNLDNYSIKFDSNTLSFQIKQEDDKLQKIMKKEEEETAEQQENSQNSKIVKKQKQSMENQVDFDEDDDEDEEDEIDEEEEGDDDNNNSNTGNQKQNKNKKNLSVNTKIKQEEDSNDQQENQNDDQNQEFQEMFTPEKRKKSSFSENENTNNNKQLQQQQQQQQQSRSKRQKTQNKFYSGNDIAIYNPNSTKNFSENDLNQLQNQTHGNGKNSLIKQISATNQNSGQKLKRKRKKHYLHKDKEQSSSNIQQMENSEENQVVGTKKIKKNNGLASFQKIETVNIVYSDLEYQNPNEQEYCLCRFPQANDMIQCDNCLEWFHQECLGISVSIVNKIQDFYCLGCCERLNIPYMKDQQTDFVWLVKFNKITWEDYKKFVREGEQIPVEMEELEFLQVLENKMENWLQQTEQIISLGNQIQKLKDFYKIIKENVKNQSYVQALLQAQDEKDKQIMVSILQSFRFPVNFPEQEKLVKLIKQRDMIRTILEEKYGINKRTINQKQIPKKLSQNYSDFDHNEFEELILNDPECKKFYENMKNLHQRSENYQATIDTSFLSKPFYQEFKDIIDHAKDNDFIIEKLDQYNKFLKDFERWESKTIEFLAITDQKISQQELENHLTCYENLHFKSKHHQKLKQQIDITKNINQQIFDKIYISKQKNQMEEEWNKFYENSSAIIQQLICKPKYQEEVEAIIIQCKKDQGLNIEDNNNNKQNSLQQEIQQNIQNQKQIQENQQMEVENKIKSELDLQQQQILEKEQREKEKIKKLEEDIQNTLLQLKSQYPDLPLFNKLNQNITVEDLKLQYSQRMQELEMNCPKLTQDKSNAPKFAKLDMGVLSQQFILKQNFQQQIQKQQQQQKNIYQQFILQQYVQKQQFQAKLQQNYQQYQNLNPAQRNLFNQQIIEANNNFQIQQEMQQKQLSKQQQLETQQTNKLYYQQLHNFRQQILGENPTFPQVDTVVPVQYFQQNQYLQQQQQQQLQQQQLQQQLLLQQQQQQKQQYQQSQLQQQNQQQQKKKKNKSKKSQEQLKQKDQGDQSNNDNSQQLIQELKQSQLDNKNQQNDQNEKIQNQKTSLDLEIQQNQQQKQDQDKNSQQIQNNEKQQQQQQQIKNNEDNEQEDDEDDEDDEGEGLQIDMDMPQFNQQSNTEQNNQQSYNNDQQSNEKMELQGQQDNNNEEKQLIELNQQNKNQEIQIDSSVEQEENQENNQDQQNEQKENKESIEIEQENNQNNNDTVDQQKHDKNINNQIDNDVQNNQQNDQDDNQNDQQLINENNKQGEGEKNEIIQENNDQKIDKIKEEKEGDKEEIMKQQEIQAIEKQKLLQQQTQEEQTQELNQQLQEEQNLKEKLQQQQLELQKKKNEELKQQQEQEEKNKLQKEEQEKQILLQKQQQQENELQQQKNEQEKDDMIEQQSVQLLNQQQIQNKDLITNNEDFDKMINQEGDRYMEIENNHQQHQNDQSLEYLNLGRNDNDLGLQNFHSNSYDNYNEEVDQMLNNNSDSNIQLNEVQNNQIEEE